jgi:AcrR family transcriptional regulator
MTAIKKPEPPAPAGYVAHNERSRAAFLRDGVHVLETFGIDATTAQIQSVTGVSPTTLYRYFKNRETYLSESFGSVWVPWIQESLELASKFDDELITLVYPMRMILSLHKTNPTLAAIMAHKDWQIESAFPEFQGEWVGHYRSLVKSGVLPNNQAEERILPFSGAVLALVKSSFDGENSEKVNVGFEVALSMLNLSSAQIKKVMQVPLPLEDLN